MTARLRTTLTAAIVAAVALVVAAPGASATPVTPGATAYSASGYTGSATMHANLTLTGTLGGLLNSLIGPIVSSALNPLVAALQGTASTAINGVLGTNGQFHVTSPTTQYSPAPAAFPGDLPGGLPSPCTSGSATQPCYNATTGLGAISAPPLINMALTALSGYTEQVASGANATNPMFGRAQATGLSVAVLPGISSLANPLITSGTVDSIASCPNDAKTAPSANESVASVSLLGNVVTFSVANGDIANLKVNATTYGTIPKLPTLTLTGGIVVQPYGGQAVAVSLPLTLSQVATGLGLPSSVISTLTQYGVTGTSLTLTLIVGPNDFVTKTGAQAWGLGLGVDLSGALSFNLLGLVGAAVTVPTGIGSGNYGDVLDLRLAYSSCTVGSTGGGGGSTPAVPIAHV